MSRMILLIVGFCSVFTNSAFAGFSSLSYIYPGKILFPWGDNEEDGDGWVNFLKMYNIDVNDLRKSEYLANEEYRDGWVKDILRAYKIDINNFPKPEYLAMEGGNWQRGLPLIIAGVILCSFPLTRKPGMYLISMGFGYIGWQSYEDICDYLERYGLDLKHCFPYKSKDSDDLHSSYKERLYYPPSSEDFTIQIKW